MALFDAYKVTIVAEPAAAGTTDVESDSVAMAGYSEAAFLATIGTPAEDNILTLQGSNNDSDWTDLVSAAPGGTDANQYVAVVNTTYKYLRAVVERGTESTVGVIVAFRGNGRVNPQTNNTAGVIVGAVKVG